jgi:protein-L-isoaspartate(D-aspartate) O-methyltransferase
MVEEAIMAEGVEAPRVLEAMRRTPRHEFVPKHLRGMAYYDMSLPIGRGQTISAPYLVARMTEQLDPQPTDKVLEIGTGSGYQAAVLSPLVREVCTIEIVKSIGRRARATLRRLGYANVRVRLGDGFAGWPEQAPFDKIIVTCSPERVPAPLVDQLKESGRMIIPLGERYQQTLYLFTKRRGELVRQALAPVMFVPMTGAAEANRQTGTDPRAVGLINGSFEELDAQGARPAAWYYQRQLTLTTSDAAPEGKRYVTFRNTTPGRAAQASQAFALDGRNVKAVVVSGLAKGTDLHPGPGPHDLAAVVLTFFDADRRALAHVPTGDWRGTFGWRSFRSRIEVPSAAREAILRLGLYGATGALSLDRLSVEAERSGVSFEEEF